MFQTRGFAFRNTAVCAFMVGLNQLPRPQYRTHPSAYYTAYTDACKICQTITVYITVFLKMYSQVRNM